MAFTAVGELTYNNYTFDGATHITCRGTPVRDDAGRTVKYIQYDITVQAIIQGAAGTNLTMEDIRKRLQADGGQLTFINKGFGGDITVNKGAFRDVNYGPKTRFLSWESIGSSQAAEVNWQVTTFLPECTTNNAGRTKGIIALNYSVSYSINEHGDTTRSISGHLEIAATRAGDTTDATTRRKIPDSADKYWSSFRADVPLGFKRTVSRQLSMDKRRMDFTVTDTQIPSNNAYPVFMTTISGSHSVRWRRGKEGAIYRNTISMNMTPGHGISGSRAWATFVTLVRQRLAISKKQKALVFLDEIDVEEDIFGRPCKFAVGYRVMSTISDFISDAGLWQPVQGTDWSQWHSSMEHFTEQGRGHCGMLHNASTDVIVDVCATGTPSVQDKCQTSRSRAPKPPRLRNDKPEPSLSWLKYDMSMIPIRERPVIRQRILQAADKDPIAEVGPGSTGAFQFGKSGGTEDVIQETGQSSYSYVLTGSAVRAGHEIPKPKVNNIGGQPAVETDGIYSLRSLGNWFGVEVYRADWALAYVTAGSPGAVPIPPKFNELAP